MTELSVQVTKEPDPERDLGARVSEAERSFTVLFAVSLSIMIEILTRMPATQNDIRTGRVVF